MSALSLGTCHTDRLLRHPPIPGTHHLRFCYEVHQELPPSPDQSAGFWTQNPEKYFLPAINLLREGLDIPEVSLITILDADKQGFLRSSRSLIQTIGRAARNSEGHVIMYADTISEAMDIAIKETARRREIQIKYNEEHNIIPKTIIKEIRDVVSNVKTDNAKTKKLTKAEEKKLMIKLEEEMKKAASELDFERATELRDALFELKSNN